MSEFNSSDPISNGNNSDYEQSGLGAFFAFDKMIGPTLVKIMYFLGVIGVTIVSLALMFQVSFMQGLIYFIFGQLGLRISCELAVLFYKIHENTTALRDQNKQ